MIKQPADMPNVDSNANSNDSRTCRTNLDVNSDANADSSTEMVESTEDDDKNTKTSRKVALLKASGKIKIDYAEGRLHCKSRC